MANGPLRARFERIYGSPKNAWSKIAIDANAAFVALAEARPDLFAGYLGDTFGGRGSLVIIDGQIRILDIDRWVDDMIAQRDRIHPTDLLGF